VSPEGVKTFRDGAVFQGGVTRYGTAIQDKIVFKDFAQGGSFRSTAEIVAINGARKMYPAGTIFTVSKDLSSIVATLPNNTVETVESHAVFVFKDAATFTQTGGTVTTIERGSAIQFGQGGFNTLQLGGFKGAPAVEQGVTR
jgi:hypothetical protein